MHTSIYLSIANILACIKEKGRERKGKSKEWNTHTLLGTHSSEEAEEEGEEGEDKEEVGQETRKGRSRQIGSYCFVAASRDPCFIGAIV